MFCVASMCEAVASFGWMELICFVFCSVGHISRWALACTPFTGNLARLGFGHVRVSLYLVRVRTEYPLCRVIIFDACED